MAGLFLIDRALLHHHIVGIKHPVWAMAWLWMLSEAQWKPKKVWFNNSEILLQRGQFLAPLKVASKEVNMSIKQFRTFLSTLERAGMVQKMGTPKGTPKGMGATVITICKYEIYQDFEKYRAHQRADQRADEGHTKGTPRAHDLTPEVTPEVTPENTYDDVEAREAKNGIEIPTPREQVLLAMGHRADGVTVSGGLVGNTSDMLELGRWQDDLGLSLQEIIGVISDRRAGSNKQPPTVFRYFNNPMREFAGLKSAPALKPDTGANNGNGNYRGSTNRPRSGAETDDLIALAARARPTQGRNRN